FIKIPDFTRLTLLFYHIDQRYDPYIARLLRIFLDFEHNLLTIQPELKFTHSTSTSSLPVAKN
ncbi:hypothetical protein HAX54_012703, partial [Datura stramonium]|nr:hypothetical protein [Datura stramonium]